MLRTLTLRHMRGTLKPKLSTLVHALSSKCKLLSHARFDSCEAGAHALEVWLSLLV